MLNGLCQCRYSASNQGRRKHQKTGGHRLPGALLDIEKAPKKFSDNGGRKIILLYTQIYCAFLTNFFLKTLKFPNKKGIFHVNLVF